DRLVREKELVERIVDQVTAGVISLDAGGVVLLANPAARRLLGVEGGEHLATALMARPELAPLVRLLRGGLAPGSRGAIRVPVEGGQDREWSVAWVEVPGRGDAAHLLVVEDDTEVLRGQRLEAWAEMARLIAHEIKNPLTPIRLSTEHLREVWQRDRQRFPEALERCVANILRQVDELREIAGEFASYAGVPTLERTPGDLAAVVREIVDAYGEAPERTARVEMSGPGSLPLRFDSRLLGRALRNLMENALRAAGDGGRVRVELRQREGQIEVAVQDTGPGVAPELLSRIFEPYFSTQAGGTGLGLPIARRIAEGHGGTLAARNLAAGGLEVVLRLPES
ncbi:MAG: PAS domain-containing protein, partial [Thermoanaerobaculia bacterium]|nr:PAS domain-containing protein [Thermoanaerobaculia bacterium]